MVGFDDDYRFIATFVGNFFVVCNCLVIDDPVIMDNTTIYAPTLGIPIFFIV